MKMRRDQSIALIIIVVFFSLIFALTTYHKGPWRGRVIDARTKQPIEGAAVVAKWDESAAGPAGKESTFLDAEETKTDKNGDFKIPWKWFVDVPLFRMVGGPTFIIYKPGYGNYPYYQVSPRLTFTVNPNPNVQSDFFESKGAVVELPEFTTRKERLDALSCTDIITLKERELIFVPYRKVPYLFKLMNEERIYLGFEPYRVK